MDSSRVLLRRHLLAGGVAVTFGVFAGCVGNSNSGGDTDPDSDGSETGSERLNLREANVVGVVFERQGDTYQFDVTLRHDDEGEDGYADWWQVERLDGTRLGRRELRHAHSRQPFTRSATVAVPDSVDCVVVRGHDQTHGYGGQAMLVALSGETRAVDQGTEQSAFESGDCTTESAR